MTIYRVKYSYLAGHPDNLKRTYHTSAWFMSETRMKECHFWTLAQDKKREFQFEIEKAKLDTTCY